MFLATLTLTAQMTVALSLPMPRHDSGCSVEHALRLRRSIRDYTRQNLNLTQLAQLLWAAQGVTDLSGKRTAPSAGALYPLEVFVIAGAVVDLPAGIYRYRPQTRDLVLVRAGDVRAALVEAARGQAWIAQAPVTFVFAANEARVSEKYGRRAPRYIAIETGHAAQNIALQAICLGLGTGMVGAFDDLALDHVLGLPEGQQALYVVPAGYPAH